MCAQASSYRWSAVERAIAIPCWAVLPAVVEMIHCASLRYRDNIMSTVWGCTSERQAMYTLYHKSVRLVMVYVPPSLKALTSKPVRRNNWFFLCLFLVREVQQAYSTLAPTIQNDWVRQFAQGFDRVVGMGPLVPPNTSTPIGRVASETRHLPCYHGRNSQPRNDPLSTERNVEAWFWFFVRQWPNADPVGGNVTSRRSWGTWVVVRGKYALCNGVPGKTMGNYRGPVTTTHRRMHAHTHDNYAHAFVQERFLQHLHTLKHAQKPH